MHLIYNHLIGIFLFDFFGYGDDYGDGYGCSDGYTNGDGELKIRNLIFEKE